MNYESKNINNKPILNPSNNNSNKILDGLKLLILIKTNRNFFE